MLLAHLGNISYRLGEDLPFDRLTRDFEGNPMFRESFENMSRHLVAAGQMDLANSTCRLGPKLSFDAQAEKFVPGSNRSNFYSRSHQCNSSVHPDAC